MESPTSPLIVAIDHPSLDQAAQEFAEALRREQRFFGGSAEPKPSQTLINRVISTGATRLGAMVDDAVIGMCRVQHDGRTSIVVHEAWRRRGVGRSLLTVAIERSARAGLETMVVQTSRRGRGVLALGRSVGATVIDQGYGRVDLLLDTDSLARTA